MCVHILKVAYGVKDYRLTRLRLSIVVVPAAESVTFLSSAELCSCRTTHRGGHITKKKLLGLGWVWPSDRERERDLTRHRHETVSRPRHTVQHTVVLWVVLPGSGRIPSIRTDGLHCRGVVAAEASSYVYPSIWKPTPKRTTTITKYTPGKKGRHKAREK